MSPSVTANVVRALETAETPADLEAFLDGLGVPADATIQLTANPRRGDGSGYRYVTRADAIGEALDDAARLDELRRGVLDDEPARWRHAEEDRLVDELNTLATALLEAAR